MKRKLVCTFFLIGCSVGAFAQNQPPDKMASDKMSAAPKNSDARFAKDAAAGGMAEVKLGQLAQEKGSNDFVKQFGERMVKDHGKANDELKEVAQKENIELPSDISPRHQATYDRLSKLSGDAFDQAYIAAMVKDHKKDAAEFRKQANKGSNANVKQFASQTLPVIEQHLKMLQSKAMM